MLEFFGYFVDVAFFVSRYSSSSEFYGYCFIFEGEYMYEEYRYIFDDFEFMIEFVLEGDFFGIINYVFGV